MDVEKFVAGLHVLAVDDDPVSLMLIAKQLRLCKYKVTTVMHPEMALEMLRARKGDKDQFDIVITDVHMPGINGFKLLELIGLELDIPVIMLSANDTFKTMVKGLQHGARDYLVKPVHIEQLKPIWKHVARKNDTINCTNSSNANDDSQRENGETNHTMNCLRKKKKHRDIETEDTEDMSAPKRKRIQWTSELHRKFVRVVNHIGIHNVVPKKILDMMNVEGLTREHVASHLQKYRLYLKKVSDGTFSSNSPFTNESVWSQENSVNINGEEHLEHDLENGGYQPSFIGSSGLSNTYARMNSPAAFGTHSLLPTKTVQLMTQNNLGIPLKDMGSVGSGGNTSWIDLLGSQQDHNNFTSVGSTNTNICFPSGPYGNSFANISNGMSFNGSKPFPSCTSSNSFANIPNGSSSLDPFKSYANMCELEATRKDVPFGDGEYFESIGAGEMLPPSSRFPLQTPESAAPFGLTGSIYSGETEAPSKFLNLVCKGASAMPEVGPTQVNKCKINMLSRFTALAGQNSEFHNQMASLTRAAIPIAGFSNEQVAPLFNIQSDTNSTAMTTDNSSHGGTSSATSTLPNLQMNKPAMLNQMLNSGGEGGNLPEEGGVVDLAQNGTNNALDDFFGDWLNQDALNNYGTFIDGDWEFAP